MLTRTRGNILEITFHPDEVVLAKGNRIAWATDEFKTRSEYFAEYVTYTAEADGAMLAFATELSGGIETVTLEAGETLLCRQGLVVAATPDMGGHVPDAELDYDNELALQRWTGPGQIFLQYGGTLQRIELHWGQVLKVAPELLVTVDITTDYELVDDQLGSNAGSEHRPIARIIGPGVVRLQSNTLSHLTSAAAVHSLLPEHKVRDAHPANES